MLELFDVNHGLLSEARSKELFTLRKKVFKDRLNWIVNSENNMEYDEYDNYRTNYILGLYNNLSVCGVRFIELQFNNMILGTFKSYFKKIELPEGNYVEASRLFIDKGRIKSLALQHQPVSALLFLSMINYARHFGYEGIYAIVSHPMYIIFKRSGWAVSEVEEGLSEKDQKIHLIFMPVDDANQRTLIELVKARALPCSAKLDGWPLSFPIKRDGSDQL
ncbi:MULTISPECIES: acyl-homoserine-lactone synthase [Erwinia]|uniref:acyl-homoserine-lactone synthase n=1 Tax=Erwinia TaxID=551 RepID=UPI00055983DE|nr:MULTISPECIES: acyl-homoserine-lactone synthase [Erwinia]